MPSTSTAGDDVDPAIVKSMLAPMTPRNGLVVMDLVRLTPTLIVFPLPVMEPDTTVNELNGTGVPVPGGGGGGGGGGGVMPPGGGGGGGLGVIPGPGAGGLG